jgi:integrase
MGVRVAEKNKGSGVWWVFTYHQGARKAKKVGDKRAAYSGAN